MELIENTLVWIFPFITTFNNVNNSIEHIIDMMKGELKSNNFSREKLNHHIEHFLQIHDGVPFRSMNQCNQNMLIEEFYDVFAEYNKKV